MKKKITQAVVTIFCFLFFTNCQTLNKNRQVASRYFEEIINKQKPELLEEVYDKDYIFYSLENFTEQKGIKQLKDFLPYFFKAFPDIHYTIENIVAERNKVIVQAIATGTQKGEFWGNPASNNKIKVSEIFIFTMKNNKIIESRRLVDLNNLLKQITAKK